MLSLGTPILTRRMTMRRETIRALEVRKNSVMAERRKSQMQTLGANNEYGVVANVRFPSSFIKHASNCILNSYLCFSSSK